MNISYFERWFWKKGQGIGYLSEEKAKVRHEKSEAYVAVVEGQTIVDLAGKWVSVSFLDAQARPYLRYDFEAMDRRLFLKGAQYWGFDGQPSELVEYIIFNFNPSGAYVVERTLGSEVTAIEGTASTTSLWAEQVEFGNYENLLVTERGLPPIA
jgi:hypothetical protein